jgi:predicted Zn-dependent protease
MSVRSPDNTGSGWAGQEGYDFSTLRPEEVAAKALDKCERSRSPSAVEPGRWTTILEPAAYADMMHFMMHNEMPLKYAEKGYTVFANPKGGTKIGLKVLSERFSLVSDPFDPDGPFRPFSDTGEPFERTYWIKDGILRDLPYDDEHARKIGKPYRLANPESISQEPAKEEKLLTLDEMVASCERGIYVTRLSGTPADFRYMTFSGVTRDGTWLIERGKITRPIKNMRYLESPLFFLNNIEAVGKPELVPVSHVQLVLPPVRVRDFNFNALADSV